MGWETNHLQNLYREMFHSNPLPMWVFDLESHRFVLVNEAACRDYGYSEAEFLGLRLEDIRLPNQHARLQAELARPLGEGLKQRGVWQHQRKDGSLISVEVTAQIVDFRGRAGGLVMARNVTEEERLRAAHDEALRRLETELAERRKAEEELRRSHDLLRAVAEGTTDAIFAKDLEGRYLMINTAGTRFIGRPAEQIIGQDDTSFMDQPTAQLVMSRDREIMQSGQVTTDQERIVMDGVPRVYSATKGPLWSSEGTITGLIGISRDITALKEVEENLERLVQERTAELAAVNEELESFAYSVSHDLRAPLRSIDGFSQALEEDCAAALPPEGIDQLRRIRAATQRMSQLIDGLLVLSRVNRGELHRSLVDLSRIACDILQDLELDPATTVSIAPSLTVVGDAALLRVAIENLLSNAVKFTGKVAAPRIEFGRNELGEFYIRDNGAGFDMRHADKLFGPFQRLHLAHQFPGTGIGLATVMRVVKRHGGSLRATSEPGQGASFYFKLDAA